MWHLLIASLAARAAKTKALDRRGMYLAMNPRIHGTSIDFCEVWNSVQSGKRRAQPTKETQVHAHEDSDADHLNSSKDNPSIQSMDARGFAGNRASIAEKSRVQGAQSSVEYPVVKLTDILLP